MSGPDAMPESRAVAVILNWRDAPATLRCLAAVRAQAGLTGIVVVDNGSGDGSAAALAEGIPRLCGVPGAAWEAVAADVDARRLGDTSVYLLRLTENFGYAGGNNRGMHFAQKRFPAAHFWIVNPDAVPTDGALAALLRVAEADRRAGFVGSVLVHDGRPDVVQCYGGGRVHRALGRTRLALKGVPLNQVHGRVRGGRRAQVDYVMGASMLVRRDVLAQVGPMDERYFMYWEEVDWQVRARAAGWRPAVAPDSVVRHGGGAGSGAAFHYHLARAAVLFRRKHAGALRAAATALAVAGIGVVQSWRRPVELGWTLRGVMDGLAGRTGPGRAG